MAVYIVRNIRGEEIGRHADFKKTQTVAEKLRAAILQDYSVEEATELNSPQS